MTESEPTATFTPNPTPQTAWFLDSEDGPLGPLTVVGWFVHPGPNTWVEAAVMQYATGDVIGVKDLEMDGCALCCILPTGQRPSAECVQFARETLRDQHSRRVAAWALAGRSDS